MRITHYSNKQYAIALVEESEKFEKIQLVEPNLMYNRPDWLGRYDFQILQVVNKANNKRIYIPFLLVGGLCDVKTCMMEVEKSLLEAVMAFLSKKFRVFRFEFGGVRQSLAPNFAPIEWCNYVLDLPDSYDEYLAQFSRKASYNRRREIRILNNDYRCEIKHLTKEEIPLDYVHQLIKRKSEQFGGQNNHIITRAAPTYFCITDCWVMTLNEKIAAMIFYIIVPGSSEAWVVDTMYDPEYKKYSVGQVIIHHSIKDLINKKMTRIHWGGEIFLIKMRDYIALNMRLVTGLLKYLNPYLLCSIKRLANFSKKPLNSLNL